MLLGVLGGSFNPVHIGHLRIALEVREALGLNTVDFVPASRPPHKIEHSLLPFEFRVELLELAVQNLPGMQVNLLEADRPGVSYTYHTLKDYQRHHSGQEIFFILGSNDLLTLPKWYKWRSLPELASFAVVGRQGLNREQVRDFVQENFPDSRPDPHGQAQWILGENSRMIYIQVPRLDISSSLLRFKLAQGLSVHGLVPEAVQVRLLEQDLQELNQGVLSNEKTWS